jgi:WD40-like Beta Propeller Repeat
MRRALIAFLSAACLLAAGFTATAHAGQPPPFVPIDQQRVKLPKDFQASTPIWTEDGRHLLFSSGGDLYLIGQNGKGLDCLSCGLADKPEIEPAVQEAFKDVFPDGKRILWGDFEHAWVLECTPSVLNCRKQEVLPIDVSGSAPPGAPLTLGTGVWHLSPDGKYLGWTATRLDVRPMLIGRLERTADSYVATDVRAINPPAPTSPSDPDPRHWTNGSALYELKGFSPDGRSVNYVSSRYEGNPDLFSVDLKTGAVTRVTSYPDWDEDNGISADGDSMVLYSDRGMHRVDAAGLVPRRSFIDFPISANAAIYYVGHDVGFQCDLQPWLLPSSGDRGGTLLGQPLAPYTGGKVHPQNNVPGRGAWNPKSTKVALTEMSYATDRGVNRLLIAKLDRKPTKPVKVRSSAPGDWAPTPEQYAGVADTTQTVTLDGLAAGTATVSYSGNLIFGDYSVTYDGYSDDGRTFIDGTESIESRFGSLPAHNLAEIAISGKHEGSLDADFSMGRNAADEPTASGQVAASLDGYELAGSVQKLGPCPDMLPAVQPLNLKSKRTGKGLAMRITADTAPNLWAGGDRGDLRPVAGARIKVGGKRLTTNAKGRAKVRLSPGHYRLTASAGDTFDPVRERVRAGR